MIKYTIKVSEHNHIGISGNAVHIPPLLIVSSEPFKQRYASFLTNFIMA